MEIKDQEILFLGLTFLHPISTHPRQVERGALGFFMSKENISLFAHDFNFEFFFERNGRNFKDLPEKYREKIIEIIIDIEESISSKSLEDVCNRASSVCEEIESSILELK